MDSSIAYFWLHVDEWHCATSSNTTATNMENSDCLHSTKQLNTKNTNIVYKRLPDCIQCFDAVGWAAGRASGL